MKKFALIGALAAIAILVGTAEAGNSDTPRPANTVVPNAMTLDPFIIH